MGGTCSLQSDLKSLGSGLRAATVRLVAAIVDRDVALSAIVDRDVALSDQTTESESLPFFSWWPALTQRPLPIPITRPLFMRIS